MAAWANWTPPGMEYMKNVNSKGEMQLTHASQCDDATRYRLRQWVEAKRAKDFATADPIRNELRTQRVDPDKICAQDTYAEWAPLIMNAEKPVTPTGWDMAPGQWPGTSSMPGNLAPGTYIDPMTNMPTQMPTQMRQGQKRSLGPSRSYEELDDETKKQVHSWLDYKRNKDYQNADNIRVLLRCKNVDPDTVMVETDWLKKFKTGNSWSSDVAHDAGPITKVIRLSLDPASQLPLQGYPHPPPAVEYNKDQAALSESTWILQEFFEKDDFNRHCQFQHDAEGTMFPEIHAAWKAAGQWESLVTVATCPGFQVAAVGIGGKKNGERAAKLALAVALAGVHPRADHVKATYPSFTEVLLAEERLQSGIRE